MKIQLLAVDCDGVLTDGTFHFNGDDVPVRQFNYRDIMGLALLQRGGIGVAVISAEPLPAGLKKRLDIRAKYPAVQTAPVIVENTRDKAAALKQIADERGIK